MMWNYFSELVPIKKCQKFRRDSEFTIVTNMSNKFLYLNNTAADFFELCNGKNTVDDILCYLLKKYDVDSTILKNDIITIIRDFQWNHILGLSKRTLK